MTFAPVPAVDVRGRSRPPIWLGAVITTASVSVGSAAGLLTLPSVTSSVTDVAQDYLEARLAGNHLVAWNLECQRTHAYVGGLAGYEEAVTSWDKRLDLPAHVEVGLGDLHRRPGGLLTITATVTSADRRNWMVAGELPMSFEGGRFQVCDDGLGPLGLL